MVTGLNLENDTEFAEKKQRRKMHPHKFTLMVAIASILMMFAGLTSAFIVKSNLAGWRTIHMPKVFWASTLVILLCSLAVHLALRSLKNREMKKYRLLMLATLLLGSAFLFLQWEGFRELWYGQKISWKGSTGAGQFLYVIFGLHGLHVIGGIVATVIIWLKSLFGKTKIYSPVPTDVVATYWHFVDALWLYLFLFFLIVG